MLLLTNIIIAASLIAWEARLLLPIEKMQLCETYCLRNIFYSPEKCSFRPPLIEGSAQALGNAGTELAFESTLTSFFSDLSNLRGPVSLQFQMEAEVSSKVTDITLQALRDATANYGCATQQLLTVRRFACESDARRIENFFTACFSHSAVCVIAFLESHFASNLECAKSAMSNQSFKGAGFIFFDGSVPGGSRCRVITKEAYNEDILGRIRHWSGRVQYKERICA